MNASFTSRQAVIHRTVIVAIALFVVAIGGMGWMQSQLKRLQAEARELTARNGALLARIRQERELTAALAKERAQPGHRGGGAAVDAPKPAAETAADSAADDPALAAEASAWIARWQALHAEVVQHPEAVIPEFGLLGEMDWLQVARTAEFDTPGHVRRSLAALRTAAKQKFAAQLSIALRAYLAETAGRLPMSVETLAPYFDPPVDSAILQRYEEVRLPDGHAPTAGVSFIRERSVMDEEFDSRYGVDASGGVAATSPAVTSTPGTAEVRTGTP